MNAIAARLPAHRHSVVDLPRRADPPDGGSSLGSSARPVDGPRHPQLIPTSWGFNGRDWPSE